MDSSIRGLTVGLAAGDEEAFRRFHQLYFDRLLRYLAVVAGGDEQAALDALQETFLRVVRHARPFDDETVFWCWLLALARSAARDGGRRKRSYLKAIAGYARSLVARPLPAGVDPHVDERLASRLGAALEALDEGERRLVEGKYYQGKRVKELALEMKMSEKAVESRLLRARRKIRTELLSQRNHDIS